jgi:hypothetical protein
MAMQSGLQELRDEVVLSPHPSPRKKVPKMQQIFQRVPPRAQLREISAPWEIKRPDLEGFPFQGGSGCVSFLTRAMNSNRSS